MGGGGSGGGVGGTGGGAGGAGGVGGTGGMTRVAQITNPSLSTEPSENHENVSPGDICTLLGPLVPSYLTPLSEM